MRRVILAVLMASAAGSSALAQSTSQQRRAEREAVRAERQEAREERDQRQEAREQREVAPRDNERARPAAERRADQRPEINREPPLGRTQWCGPGRAPCAIRPAREPRQRRRLAPGPARPASRTARRANRRPGRRSPAGHAAAGSTARSAGAGDSNRFASKLDPVEIELAQRPPLQLARPSPPPPVAVPTSVSTSIRSAGTTGAMTGAGACGRAIISSSYWLNDPCMYRLPYAPHPIAGFAIGTMRCWSTPIAARSSTWSTTSSGRQQRHVDRRGVAAIAAAPLYRAGLT